MIGRVTLLLNPGWNGYEMTLSRTSFELDPSKSLTHRVLMSEAFRWRIAWTR
jgi:hypothetical protein